MVTNIVLNYCFFISLLNCGWNWFLPTISEILIRYLVINCHKSIAFRKQVQWGGFWSTIFDIKLTYTPSAPRLFAFNFHEKVRRRFDIPTIVLFYMELLIKKYKSLLVKIWFGLNYIYLIFRQYWRYIRWLVCGRFINYSMSIRNKSFFYYCMSCWKMFTFDSRKWTMANWLYYRSKLLKVIYVLKFAIIHLRRR